MAGYSFESRIRYSEVDRNAKLTYLDLVDYFQDCSVAHSESLGVGVDFLSEHHCAWVINFWQIRIDKMPMLFDEVKITTMPYEIKGFFGQRNFLMEKEDGERLAYANSIWTLIDTDTFLPRRVLPEMGRYEMCEPLEMEKCPRKLPLPEGMAKHESFTVTPHLLDTNGHVNNGRYIELALGFLPEDFQIKEIRVEYKMQGLLGDVFVPMTCQDDEKVTVVMANEDGKPYAIMQFLER